ncbi:MAG: rhamnulose-1-phosphate aldolase [Bacteroidetes bacterium]|nr:rhamnulose-1-phosphate aldolase [Bacteroidota bacterium]
MEFKSLEKIAAEIADTAGCLWEKGWAERNAGNISVNVTDLLSAEELSLFDTVSVEQLRGARYTLGDQVIVVTAAGSRMRDIARDPRKYLCVLKITSEGTGYQILTAGGDKPTINSEKRKAKSENPTPTSELPTHLAVHEMLVRTNSSSKALVHTHCTELIALTQISELCSTEKLNRLLWGMHPETILFVPKGVGFIPFEIPGTSGIAGTTVKTLETYPVALWEKHGVLATGSTAADAFDTIDLLAKSAKIYFLVKSAGYEPEGLTEEQLGKLMS